jgi:hypothetical protein
VLFRGISSDGDDSGALPFALESCVLLQDNASVDSPRESTSEGRQRDASNEEQEANGTFTATLTDLPPRDSATEEAMRGQRTTTTHGTTGGISRATGASFGGLGAAGVSYCGVGSQGKRIVYVIDRSLSMGLNGTFRHACDQLFTSLDNLPAEVRFQVLLYNRHAEPLRVKGSTDFLAAESENRDQVRQLIRQTRSEGATDHLEALKAALRLHPDVIYLATDADDLTQKVINEVAAYNKGKAVIHTIEVTRWQSAERTALMKLLATSNGGTYRAEVVKSKSD